MKHTAPRAVLLLVASVFMGAVGALFAQPRADVGDGPTITPKWSVRVYADGKRVAEYETNEVNYLGDGVFMFVDADLHHDVQVCGTVIVEARW